jgi:bacterioferritin
MLEFGLAFETKAVKVYNEALELAEGDRALEIFLEDILKEEQDGVDEISKLLKDASSAKASLGHSKTG